MAYHKEGEGDAVTGETLRNAWVPQPQTHNGDAYQPQPVAPAYQHGPRLQPQPDSVPRPAGGLPLSPTALPPTGGVFLLGCHGGAGVTSLTHAVPGTVDALRMWPQAQLGTRHRVVLVCRSHHSGLTAAQTAIRQWASGAVPGVELLGLAVVADAPGTLPRALKDLHRLIRGGVPESWPIPWADAWRLGDSPAHHMSRQLAAFARALARYTEGNPHHG
ncbi:MULTISPECIES: DUF6668 family protein [unclassified Streptomyces]|uniref:DUF6668 family protein n=1 Tax=unclassified Streptomyces TaxID=2593676 RepID=UPI0033EC240A